ncbi:D-alanyl-D-alanine carboxypeptidase [Gammaproteobacteria bacterium]|nr:D-alanyl-D-alanine carboxypeptidase [Gammaproteobacteria bacterium]
MKSYISRLTNFFAAILIALISMPLLAGLTYANTGFSALVIEPDTGRILYEYNSNEARYPASLTKVMTLYMIFDALKHGQVNLNTSIVFSQKAVSQQPSKLGAKLGETIPLELAIKILVVKSANDVSVAVAEKLSGSEDAFVIQMNNMAKKLGLQQTNFTNSHGLPSLKQLSTAHDMAILASRIQKDFPKYFHNFSVTSFVYNDKVTETHNRVMRDYYGATGMKTGYIRLSGFNLITTATRSNKRIIGVVFGGKTAKDRDEFMTLILDKSFEVLLNSRNKKMRIDIAVNPDIIVVHPSVQAQIDAQKATQKKQVKTAITPPIKKQVKTAITPPTKNQVQPPKASSQSSAKYSIQVGSFKEYKNAQAQSHSAIKILGKGRARVASLQNGYHRALIDTFNQQSAANACSKLKAKDVECLVIRQ